MEELGGKCYKCGFRGHHAYQCRNIVNGAEMALDVSSTSSDEDADAAGFWPKRRDRSRSPVRPSGDPAKAEDNKAKDKKKKHHKEKKTEARRSKEKRHRRRSGSASSSSSSSSDHSRRRERHKKHKKAKSKKDKKCKKKV